MFKIEGKCNSAIVMNDNCNNETISQILGLCNQEWTKDSKIVIQADCHAGAGCVIGTTMTIHDKVCPNLVGSDINCGILVVELPKDINIDYPKLDEYITNHIPSGYSIHEKIQDSVKEFYKKRKLEELTVYDQLKNDEMDYYKGIGTLGGGNHFIEIDEDDFQNKYLVIHTGSRNLGYQVARLHQKQAIKQIKEKIELKENALKLDAQEIDNLDISTLKKIPKDLCYLQGDKLNDYLHDIDICAQYAHLNRITIASLIIKYLFNDTKKLPQFKDNGTVVYHDIEFSWFETVHNYIDLKHNILRKGAISCQKGEKVIIPLNMKDGSIIGYGLGNPDFNYSGPHGAGRLLSRGEAKEILAIEEYKEVMKNIYTSSVDITTLDESPMAYKPIQEIIDIIEGNNLQINKIIKPKYNFKAH